MVAFLVTTTVDVGPSGKSFLLSHNAFGFAVASWAPQAGDSISINRRDVCLDVQCIVQKDDHSVSLVATRELHHWWLESDHADTVQLFQ